MNTLLGEEEIARADNIELFQSLLQQSQVNSSGVAESSHIRIIELSKDTELTNLVIQGFIIEGNNEIAVNTYRDAFIQILEILIDSNMFKSFVTSRSKTNQADLPDRIFSKMDNTLTSDEIKYPASSVKYVHGVELVLHYGRADLNRYLFKFLDAFYIAV